MAASTKKSATPKKKTPAKKAPAKAAKPVKAKAAPAKKKVAAKAPAKKKAVTPKKARAVKVKAPKSLPEILRDAALKVLDDRKAEDIVSADLRGQSPIADFAVVATGRSSRQLAAMAQYLREAFLKEGVRRVRVEGVEQGDWVLVDSGDVIVHLFRPEVRDYYRIEQIWSASSPARKGK